MKYANEIKAFEHKIVTLKENRANETNPHHIAQYELAISELEKLVKMLKNAS